MKTKMTIKNQKGASAVEFAIVLPLLLLLLFGIVEFGFLLYNKAMITNAAREGARAGIVFDETRLSESGICQVVYDYCEDHLINFDPAENVHCGLDADAHHNDTHPKYTPAGLTSLTDVDDAITSGSISSGDSLTVHIEYNYEFLVFPNLARLVGGSFSNDPQHLEAEVVMRYE
jgi:hypothetical protein